MSPQTDVQEVLVLEPDRLCGTVLARTVSTIFPAARVYCEGEPSVAAQLLAERAIGLLIVAVRGFDIDILTLLGVWAEQDVNRTRVLVVTPDANSTAMMVLRRLPISGIFDSSCTDFHELEKACRTVVTGSKYVSRSVSAAAEAPHEDDGEHPLLDDANWIRGRAGVRRLRMHPRTRRWRF